MTVRRCAAALAAATAVLGGAAPAAFADGTPSPAAVPPGLYGTKDPQYDGVFRQSLAFLAQEKAGVKPAGQAVTWLTGQQCESGAFTAFRADATKPCDPKAMPDTNATSAAVQALVALGGHDDAVKKGIGWLKSVQNDDGGWAYNPGSKSDANSTAIVIGALAAAGEKPAEVKSAKGGKSPFDGLLTFALPCDGPSPSSEGAGGDPNGGGAFAYQGDLKTGKLYANADATAAAVTGSLGKGLTATAGPADAKGTACEKATTPEQAAHNGAAYLARTLAPTGFLKSAMPGAESQPDFGNTADAVVALAADGLSQQAKASADWLAKNATAWAKESGPAAYAQLIFAADATGADPTNFGGVNLVKSLNATGPAPESAASPAPSSEKSDQKSDDKNDGISVWWIVGVGLVAGIGVGFLISGRKKNQQL
ncbi:prenyltransferase/squalene oxidase repeat-containing protein [Streptomyces sp. NPDC059095]|uniref:prenyltransferase/squalene oxidase repeat-containing protein n=1 Tax=Streptomyces sp. NPDC059095 TaxID=3346726 RepID=UPI0036CAB17F